MKKKKMIIGSVIVAVIIIAIAIAGFAWANEQKQQQIEADHNNAVESTVNAYETELVEIEEVHSKLKQASDNPTEADISEAVLAFERFLDAVKQGKDDFTYYDGTIHPRYEGFLSDGQQQINEFNDLLSKVSLDEETAIAESEPVSFITQFAAVNQITYPPFTFDYPNNWTIARSEVTQNSETVTLVNDRGASVEFVMLAPYPEGGHSSVSYLRDEITKMADSQFVPSYVQADDYSSLGSFMVAELHTIGELDMMGTSGEFTEMDGKRILAIVPES